MKIAVLFHRLGPYHHARLTAAGKRCDVTAIELSAVDDSYAWEPIEGAQKFTRITLFGDSDVVTQPAPEVLRRVHESLTSLNPEAVAINGWADRGALAALLWCVNKRVPAVIMSDSQEIDEPRSWWKEAVKSRIVGFCSAGLVAGTRHVEYLEKLGMAEKQIFVGYDVVNNDYFFEKSNEAQKIAKELELKLGLPEHFFLSSNRFIKKKNLHRLLRAYAKYLKKNNTKPWGLVLLGDGPLWDSLARLKTDLGLDDKVLMPGFKQYSELPQYYGLADCFVHVSKSEQWGLVVNEAMASGLPVLVSNRCGCSFDLIEEGVNGWTFDPYDIDAIAELMGRVSHPQCDLKTMGRHSQDIIAKWSPDTFAKGLAAASKAAMQNKNICFSPMDKMIVKYLIKR